MAQEFDKDYWEAHWEQATGHRGGPTIVPNPYLASETSGLVTGSALDAGCGEGAEAIWLGSAGWQVTAVDISTEALSRAAERASAIGLPPERVHWVEADLGVWEPGRQFDLVTTHYAHPAMPQLDFYQRISNWVAPGGTLLIVGHLHSSDTPDHHAPDQRTHPRTRARATSPSSRSLGDRGPHHQRNRPCPLGSRHRRAPLANPHQPGRPGGPVGRRRRAGNPKRADDQLQWPITVAEQHLGPSPRSTTWLPSTRHSSRT